MENTRFVIAPQPSLRDYENFAILHEKVGKGSVNRINRVSNWVLRVMAVIMPICALILIALERRVTLESGAALVLGLFCVCFWLFGKKLTARLTQKQNEKLSHDVTVVVDDTGIRIQSAQANSAYRFEAIESIYRWREAWYFYVDAMHAQMLPFRCFTEGDPALFGDYLSEKTGLPVQTPADKKKKGA